jgi:hypothetical protein
MLPEGVILAPKPLRSVSHKNWLELPASTASIDFFVIFPVAIRNLVSLFWQSPGNHASGKRSEMEAILA